MGSIEDWQSYYDVQSQVMGWLGDGNSYVDAQAELLASQTFSWGTANRHDKRRVATLIEDTLQDLENRGMAIAASPYRLTERGSGARLTGLSVPTIVRLERAIERGRDGWMQSLVGLVAIDRHLAVHVAHLLLESLEVAQQSLWLRRVSSNPARKFEALQRFADGDDTIRDSDEYDADVELLAGWMMGRSYMDLARMAPVYSHAGALFGGSDTSKRVSDATEYIGKLSYPASWTWTGATLLAGYSGEAIPSFMRSAVELGVPTEGASVLIQRAGVTRATAIGITDATDVTWSAVYDWLLSDAFDSGVARFTDADQVRLRGLRERLAVAE